MVAYERFVLLALLATGVLGVTALLFPAQKEAGPVSATGSGNSGLVLNLSINSSSIAQGHSVEVHISETNSLSSMNNVTASQNWGTNFSLGRCSADYPFGITLFKGHYTLQNFMQGERVSLQSPVQLPVREATLLHELLPLPPEERHGGRAGRHGQPDGNLTDGDLNLNHGVLDR